MPMDINMCGELGGEIVSKNLGGGKSAEVCRVYVGGRDINDVVLDIETKLVKRYEEYLWLTEGSDMEYGVLFRDRDGSGDYVYLLATDDYVDLNFFNIYHDDFEEIMPVLADIMYTGLNNRVVCLTK